MTERRRGADLENAILDAAWAEIVAEGYANLTMERIAARAGTSRPVLSRRWASVSDITLAAIQRELAHRPIAVADQGDVRAELLDFLQQVSERSDVFQAGFALFLDRFRSGTSASPSDFRARVLVGGDNSLDLIFERAIARGEIDADKLTPVRRALLSNLFRHHVMMTMSPPSEAMRTAWVDEVFLPLVRAG